MPTTDTSSVRPDATVTIVEPRTRWTAADLAELWRFRDLLWILAARDIKVRYRQTVVGALWAVLQPVATMVLFSGLFSLLGRTPASAGTPYVVSSFCGLLPWQMLAYNVTQASTSLVANQALVTKVYFPRVLLPIAPALTGLVDFLVAFVVLLGMMVAFHIHLTSAVLLSPFFLLLALWLSIAIGIHLAALTALFRDFRFVVPLLIQVGFLVSPVVYETKVLVPAAWRWVYDLNPTVAILDGFRWCLLGSAPPSAYSLVASLVVTAGLTYLALASFRSRERDITDRI